MLVQFGLVVARYVFGLGSIWLTETVVYGNADAVHAGGGLDAARWRPRAGRYFLCRRFAAREGDVDLFGALLLLLPFALVLIWLGAALRGALMGDPGALAGNQRPAAGVRAQDS